MRCPRQASLGHKRACSLSSLQNEVYEQRAIVDLGTRKRQSYGLSWIHDSLGRNYRAGLGGSLFTWTSTSSYKFPRQVRSYQILNLATTSQAGGLTMTGQYSMRVTLSPKS